MAYEIVEKCGCGASLIRAVYPLDSADRVCQEFRANHRHIEPKPPEPDRIVIRVPRGQPRLRATRRLRLPIQLNGSGDETRDR